MAKAKYLVWVDLESSGLDEHQDPIIEIGLVVTEASPPFNEIDSMEAVVTPDPERYPDWKHRMNSYVRNMHTTNGLLNDVGGLDSRTMESVENQIVEMLTPLGRPQSFMLAGSGVGHFDHKFINAQMPTFAKWLQYPCIDVGVLRRAFSFSGRNDLDSFGQTFSSRGAKPHRGLADVRDHLNEFRRYSEMFAAIPPLVQV